MQADARSDEMTGFGRAIILGTMALATMLYAMSLTIVNVALPQLQGALSATQDQIAWVVTLNVVATGVATPMTGWAVARFGRRRLLIGAVLGFTVSTLLCASATSLEILLFYRVAQGMFGAPLVPLSQAIILDTYPKHQHAMANSVWGMSVVVGPAIAPSIGGYLAEQYDWRWIFILIVPLGVVAFLGVWAYIKDGGKQTGVRLDWTGFLALSVAVTCLQLVFDRGERLDWFEAREIVIVTAALAISFYVFLVHTMTADKPFINPSLFTNRNFSIGLFLVFTYGMLNLTPTVLLPSLLQNLKGYPDSLIGTLLATRGLGMVFGFICAARMGKLDPRIGMVGGIVCIGISGWGMATFDLNVSAEEVGWIGALQGFGCGILWVPLTVVTFATLPANLLPDGSSVFHLIRNFGSSISISLSVMAVVRTAKVNYAELTEYVSPFNKALSFDFVMGLWNVDDRAGLVALSGEIARQATMIGYNNAFVMYTAACFGAIPFLMMVRIRR